jgi:hypothetical protein
MNLQQKISLWLGCVLFSLSNLCPPWVAVSQTREGHVWRELFLGFHFVWHGFEEVSTYVRPDFSRLILEDAVIMGVTLVAVLTMKGQADWPLRAIARRVAGRFSRYQQAALILTLLSVGVMLVSGANMQLSLGVLLLGLTLAWTVGSGNRLLHYLCLIVGVAALVTPVGLSWRQHRLSAQEFSRSVQRFEANIPRLAQRYPLNVACPTAHDFGFVPDPATEPHSNDHSGPSHSHPPSKLGGREGDLLDQVAEEEQVISINNSTELYAVLTQMGYPENEKESIEVRIAKDLDSKKIGRADWVFPCLSIPESKVDFQISSATGKEFLEFLPPWFMNAVSKGVNVTSVPANEKPGAPPSEFRVLPAFWSLPLVSFLGIVIGATGGANLTRLRRKGAPMTG